MKGGDVQNTSGLVRSLQMFAEFNEGIALLLGDGRLHQTLEEQRESDNAVTEVLRRECPLILCRGGLQEEVKPVEFSPHLLRELVPDHPGIFPRQCNTLSDAVTVLRIENEEFRNAKVWLLLVGALEILIEVAHLQDRKPSC